MRGWYVIPAGPVVKIIYVAATGTDEVRGELPADTSLGALIDFVFDTGDVANGDVLVLADRTQIRLTANRPPGPKGAAKAEARPKLATVHRLVPSPPPPVFPKCAICGGINLKPGQVRLTINSSPVRCPSGFHRR